MSLDTTTLNRSARILLAIFAMLMLEPAAAQSGPRLLNISGGLFNPNGSPVLNNNVTFRIEVRDKAGLCVLYSETHSGQDLSSTKGGFSLLLGGGSSPANKLSGTTALDANVFRNPGAVAAFTDCPSGLTLNAGDERVVRVYYDIGSGLTAMNPDVPVVAAAYAMVAETLQGKTPEDFINVQGTAAGNLQQTNLEYAFSLSNWQRLKDLIDGVSSQYLPTAGTGAFDFGNRVLTGVAAPGTTADAVNKGYADSYIGGKATDLTSVGAGFGGGQTIVWDHVQNKWVTGAPTDSTKLPLAGGTMVGNINMGGYDLLNVGNIVQGLQKSHTLGRFTSLEEATLVGTLGTGSIGMSWYNTDLKTYKIWDGSNAITQAYLSSVGTSPGTLNPSWFPASGVSAGTYGGATSVPVFTVGADGRLTVAYGTTIAGVAPGGAAGGDLTGSYPSPLIAPLAVTTAKLGDNAITAAKIKSTGVAINRLIATDPVTPNTLTYFECPINDQIMTWTASGWSCTTVAALSPVKTVAGRTPDAAGNVPLSAFDINGIESAATKDYGTAAGELVELDGAGKIPSSLLPVGTGTITSVSVVSPLTGGGVTGAITVGIDVGTGANQVVRLNASAQIPAVDGSLLLDVNASKIGTRTVTSAAPGVAQVLAWNGSQWEPTSAAVGSMTGVVSGAGMVSGTITTYGTIAVDVGTAANKVVQFDGSARYPANDGSLITNVNAVRLQSNLVSATAPTTNQFLKWNGSQWEPATDTGTGTITTVVSGAGLVAGTIVSSGTIAVDVGTGANQVVQLNGSAQIPAVDGSLLTGVNASKIGTRAVTSTAPGVSQVLAWNGSQWEPTSAAVGSVVNVTSGTGLIAGSITSSGTINIDVGSTANKIVQLDGSGLFPAIDSSNLFNVNASKIGTRAVTTTAPGVAQVLAWNGSQWEPTTAAVGSVTSVASGAGLVPGTITGTGTVAVDVGTAANKVVQFDGSARYPANDGSLITNVNAVRLQSQLVSATAPTANQILKWNGSQWEPSTDTGTGTVTSVVSGTGLVAGTITNGGTIAVDVGTGANQVVQLNGSSQIPAVDGSLLTGVNASKIGTRAVTSAAPGVAQVLAWNGSQWEPTSAAVGSVTGVVSGTGLVAGTVTSFGSIHVDVGTVANKIVQFDGSARYPANDGSLITNVNAVRLQSQLVSATAPTANQILKWNGSQWEPSTDTGTGTVTSVVSGTGLVAGTITAGGTIAVDVGTGANQVVQLNGSSQIPAVDGSLLTGVNASKIGTRAVTSTAPSVSQVLGWNGSQWEPMSAAVGSMTSVTAGAGLVPGTITSAGTIAVDVGTVANKIVQFDGSARYPANDGSLITNVNAVRLQSQLVSATAPTANQILKWNGSQWEPSTDTGTGTVTSVVSGTGLVAGTITSGGTVAVDVGTGANQVVQLNGSSQIPAVDGSLLTGVNASKIGTRAVTSAAPSVSQVLGWNGSQWEPMSAAVGSMTSVTAGAGMVPGTITSAGTVAVDVGTAANKVVQFDGSARYPANDGSLITNVNAVRLQSQLVSATAPTANQILKWNGSQWEPSTDSGTGTVTSVVSGAGLVAGTITAGGTIAVDVGTGANKIVQLNGSSQIPAVDGSLLTGVNASKIGTRDVTSAAPTPNQVLAWNGSQWEPTSAATGSVTSVVSGTGLVAGTITAAGTLNIDVGTGANKIVQLNGSSQIPAVDGSLLTGVNASTIGTRAIATTLPTTNQILTWNGSRWEPMAASSSLTWPLAANPGTTPASAPSYTFASDTDTGFYSPGVGTAAFATNGTARMTINSSGYVGIGTASPTQLLDVNGTAKANVVQVADGTNSAPALSFSNASDTGLFYSSGSGLNISDAGNARFSFYSGGFLGGGANGSIYLWSDAGNAAGPNYSFKGPAGWSDMGMYAPASGNLAFSTSGTERIRVSATGNVGIGTSTPGSVALDVVGTGANNSAILIPRNTTALRPAGANGMVRYNTNTNKFEFFENNAWVNYGTGSGSTSFPLLASPGTTPSTAPSYSFASDSDTGFYSPGVGTAALATNGTARMTVDSSGNVGIGTAAPTDILDINRNQAANTTISLTNTNTTSGSRSSIYMQAGTDKTIEVGVMGPNTAYSSVASGEAYIQGGASGLVFWQNSGSPIRFVNDATETLRLTGGKVGIGTTSPGSVALDVVGTGANNSAILIPRNTTALRPAGANGMVRYNTNTNKFEFFENNAWVNYGTGSGSTSFPLLASPGTTPSTAPSYSFASDSDTGLYSPGVGTASLATNGTARLTVDSSGNIGVGTASPGSLFHLNTTATGDNSPYMSFAPNLSNGSTVYNLIGRAAANDDSGFVGYTHSTTQALRSLDFGHYGQLPSMSIKNNGNVGIGTITPGSVALEIVGTGANNSAILIPRNTTALRPAGANGMVRYNTSTSKFEFFENNAWVNYGTGSGSTSFPLLASPGTTPSTAPSYSFTSDSDTGFFSTGAGTAAFATNGTARMTITSSGDVGIGTATPGDRLDIRSNVASGAGVSLQNTNSSGDSATFYLSDAGIVRGSVWLSNSTGNLYMGAGSTDLVFQSTAITGSSERMRITSTGQIGIGTTSPGSAALNIEGTTNTNSAIVVPRSTTATRPAGLNGMVRYNTNTSKFEFFENSAWVNYGTGSGGSVTFPLLASPGTTPSTAPSYAFTSDADTGLYSPALGNLALATNGTARLMVGSTGNVGVGASSGNSTFEVYDPGFGSAQIRTVNNSWTRTSGVDFAATSPGPAGFVGYRSTGSTAPAVTGVWLASYMNNSPVIFGSTTVDDATTERMRIASNGNVAIGTTTPGSVALDVVGTGANNSAILIPRNTTALRPAGANGMLRYNTNTNKFEFFENGSWVNYGTGSGSVSFPLLASPGTTPASAPSYSFASDSDTGFFSTGVGTAAFATNGTARMTIDSSGNVGIGTAIPAGVLEVYKPAGNSDVLVLHGSSATNQSIAANVSNWPTASQINARIKFIDDSNYSAHIAFETNRAATNSTTTTELMRLTASGALGIGTSSPGSVALDVVGTGANNSAILIPRNTTALRPAGANGMLRYNTNTNKFEFFENGGWVNYGTGAGGGATDIDGLSDAIYNSTAQSLYLGDSAGAGQVNGNSANVAIGYQALDSQNNTSSNSNTAIGFRALTANQSGHSNTAVGGEAAFSSTTAIGQTAVGNGALHSNIASAGNTAIGSWSFYNATGGYNTGVGHAAGMYVSSGGYNTALGTGALQSISGTPLTGGGNTAIGVEALKIVQGAATDNTALGASAGDNLTTGSGNIIIGANIDAPTATSSNTMTIGNLIYATGLGATGTTVATGNVGIGTSSPGSARLEIYGVTTSDSAILVPRSTTATRPAGANGMLRYNTNTSKFEFFENNAWVNYGTGSGSVSFPLLASPGTTPSTAPSYAFTSDGDTGFFSPGVGTAAFATNGTTRMTINSLGYVGVGTAAPIALFDVYGGDMMLRGNGTQFKLKTTGGGDRLSFSNNGGTNGELRMYNNSDTQTVSVTANGLTYFTGGNVGIGTDTPDSQLHVVGDSEFDQVTIWESLFVDGGDFISLKIAGDSASMFSVKNDATTVLSIPGGSSTGAGNVGIGTTTPGHPLDVNGIVRATSFITTSDGRLKRNIRPVEGITALLKLNGVRYDWKANGKSEIGLIAQDVEQIFPEAVVTDEQGFKAVKYQNLIAPVIEATKDLYGMCKANTEAIDQTNRELANVKAEVRQLKDENSQLRNQVQDLNNRFEALERALKAGK